MRDLKRIKDITDLLYEVWMEYPDLRFCQLIVNCLGSEDIYYVGDRELKDRLKLFRRDLNAKSI